MGRPEMARSPGATKGLLRSPGGRRHRRQGGQMTDDALRAEVCRVGASLYARGYVHASAGNISVRTDSGYLITPTDACLGTLNAAQLAEVNTQGEQTAGARASKTLALHRAIYAAAPDARCIIHTHATHTVALTLAGRNGAPRRQAAA